MNDSLLKLASDIQMLCIDRGEWQRRCAEHAADAAQFKTQRDASRAYATQVQAERDAARAELAGVAAQRDAHLSRSVELATRVTELEVRLAALTPAAVEVDGFRVGDLVRWVRVPTVGAASDSHWRALTDVRSGRGWYRLSSPQGVLLEDLVCKPVEVGDTVRCISGAFAGRTGVVVGRVEGSCLRMQDGGPGGGHFSTDPASLVAVAP